jgi:signal transduction histidine kinase
MNATQPAPVIRYAGTMVQGSCARRGSKHARTLWSKLITPHAGITDLAERRVAQLVFVVTLVLSGLTASATLIGLLVAPALFWERAPIVLVLLASYALIYALNRAGHRIAAFLLCVGPIWSNVVVGLDTPQDPIWYAFVPTGVVLASVLLSFRAALVIGALGAVATATVVVLQRHVLGSGRSLLVFAFVLLSTAIVLATARFRAWVEAGRRLELQKLERHLAETQRMETLGRLAAGVAHDFNNLLLVIQGNVELARRAPTQQNLDQIEAAAERSGRLIAQLLAFARQQPRSPTSLSIDPLIRDLESILVRLLGDKVALSLRLAARWPVEADPAQLEQVLVNLAVNARDAMPSGGTLEIATHDRSVDGAGSHALPAGDYVLLTVRDDGSGMDAATLERAFEPFFTTKSTGNGSGLGLATVRSIVNQSGGMVSAVSQLGAGTTFSVWLPRGPQESAQAAHAVSSSITVEDPERLRG